MNRTFFVSCLVLAACGAPTLTPDAGRTRSDGGFFFDFTPPAGAAEKGSLLITVTGEGAATDGTVFPSSALSGDPSFADGWELHYEHVLVTVGEVALDENPDLNPNDPSVTGALHAKTSGPWAIDLAQPGPLDAKEGNGQAWPLARLSGFDPTSKYALGFTVVAATGDALNVNLGDEAQAEYRAMASSGATVLLQGTATWKGDASTPACRSTDTTYDFARYPKVVHFSFAFVAPVNFLNCVNPELSPDGSRGVQTATNAQTIAQLTFHLDHPFWEALTEDSPLRWDLIAARKSSALAPGPDRVEVTLEDLRFDLEAPRDAQGNAIPWRTCGPVETSERTRGTVALDPVNVAVNPLGGTHGLANVVDYMTYNLSTFGHLNNDGLCFPARQYPSPR